MKVAHLRTVQNLGGHA